MFIVMSTAGRISLPGKGSEDLAIGSQPLRARIAEAKRDLTESRTKDKMHINENQLSFL